MKSTSFRQLGLFAMALAIAATIVPDAAEARRGGSFGSRGARTYSAPAATRVAPQPVGPMQRSMTQSQRNAQNPGAMQQGVRQPSRFGGMARGLLGGLIAGGLIAALMGGGLGALGGAGMITALLQALLIGGLIWFALRLFRRKTVTNPAFAGGQPMGVANGQAAGFGHNQTAPFTATHTNPFAQAMGGGSGAAPAYAAPPQHDITVTEQDKQAFERLLGDVQAAFGREDYAALRSLTTPEVMSYFAEELGQNATNGQRNDVTGTELLEAEVAESWAEGSTAYATIAMRYQSIDVMRDRASGAVIAGDANRPTETTELWTFVRKAHSQWLLSAIQAA